MNIDNYEKQILDFLSTDPNFCAANGLDKNLNDLPDPGKNARLKRQGKLTLFKKMLQRVEAENSEDLVDIELWKLYLEQKRLELELEIENIPKNMRLPNACGMVMSPLFLFFMNDPREPKYRLINIASRLHKTPDFINSYVKNLRTPIKRWCEMEIASIKGLPNLLESIHSWAESEKFEGIDYLNEGINKALASFRYYENWLNDVDKADFFFLGEKQMLEVIKSRGITKKPIELKEMAKSFLVNNSEEVEGLRKTLVSKYDLDSSTSADDLQKFLAEKFKVKNDSEDLSDVLNVYKKEQEKILTWIKKRDLFPILENQDLEIIKTPDFMEPTIPAGAMLCPLPLREGTRKSLIYLTLKEHLLDEHTLLSIPNMMVHEGIPGHHLQLATATTHPRLIRKITSANDLAEGWTTMLEDYMLDQGYCSDLADEVRFSAKRDIARLGARVLIDLFFMSGDKSYLDIGLECDLSSDNPFECAGNLLKKVTGFVDARVQGELDWYSQESGYPLSYLTGNQLMLELKEKFMQAENTTDRDFHQFILSQGKIPLSLLLDETCKVADFT